MLRRNTEQDDATQPVLRSYQASAIAAIRAAFALSLRVLFCLPTGGGKTVCFVYITAHAAAKGNRVIVLAHRQEIVDQISAALTAMGVPHGRIQPDYLMTTDLVQIAMIQTLVRRLDAIPAPALLVIDECHHSVSDTYVKIAAAWPNVKILGVTATPERLDGRGLCEAFDQMVIGPDVRELIEAGHLAPFRYLAPTTEIDMSRVRTTAGDFNIADLENALDQDGITGNVVAHYLKHLPGRTAIAFCCTIAHAEHVATRFRDNGIPAASIDGNMSADERRDLVKRLRDGDIRVLTSCEVISEGFDAPAVGGAILLRPTASFALFRQQVGRCLRPKPNGAAAVIVDHVGNVFRHGLPDAPHEWSLNAKRRTQSERQQAAAGCRTCKACTEVFPTGAGRDMCPVLDAEDDCIFRPRVLPEREGELVAFAANDSSPPWACGLDIRTVRGSQWLLLLQRADGDPGRLREIQVARGYKRGWVSHAVQEAAEKRTIEMSKKLIVA
jgi:superfamily II DNA or RNA helicase